MISRFVFLLVLVFSLVSCQFTETMVLNEDGSGRMSIQMDMSEMMAFSGMSEDTTVVKTDTVISMKRFFEEKKDSIAKLSKSEQAKLKKVENYNVHMTMDSETSELLLDVFVDFTDISEANDLMKGLDQGSAFVPGITTDSEDEGEDSPEVVGVAYSYKKGKFKRDAYIIDKEEHRQQVDSMKSAEAFMSGMKYKLKYTFPRKIKKSSVKDATYSLDGKTIEFERNFIEFMKDPDLLDIEVELEN